MRFLKIILIAILSILAFVALIIGYAGFKLTKGASKMIHEARETGPQTVTLTPDGAMIITALKVKGAVVLEGVELCATGVDMPGFPHSSSCVNGTCRTTIDLGATPLPKDLTIHRLYQGNCAVQVLPNIAQYQVGSYTGGVHLDPSLRSELQIPADAKIAKTPNSHYNGSGVMDFNNDTTIKLDYGTVKPLQDEFSFGGKIIHIQYQDMPLATAPTAQPVTTQQPQT